MKNLIILWFALLGADRIDLFGGYVNFVVTPFIILSFLIVCVWLIRNFIKGKPLIMRIPKNGLFLYLLFALLLLVTFLSVLLGSELAIGVKRIVLLCYQISMSVIIINLILSVKDPMKVLIKGSYLAFIIHIIFSIIIYLIWFHIDFTQSIASFLYPYIKLHPNVYSHLAMRPSGFSLDPNRGAFLLVCYSFIIYNWDKPSFKRAAVLMLAFIFVSLSLSKSAILSLFIFLAITFIQKTKKTKFISKMSLYAGLLFIIVILNFSTVSEMVLKYQIPQLITERLSTSSGTSAAMHLTFIEKGFDVAMASIKNLLFGIGYSNARSVLMKMDSSYYSNFHSIYISFLAEVGIMGFFLILIIHFSPVLFAKKYIPIILSLGVFNIFYQLTAEPIFWVMLIMAWYNYGFKKRRSGTIPIIFKT